MQEEAYQKNLLLFFSFQDYSCNNLMPALLDLLQRQQPPWKKTALVYSESIADPFAFDHDTGRKDMRKYLL